MQAGRDPGHTVLKLRDEREFAAPRAARDPAELHGSACSLVLLERIALALVLSLAGMLAARNVDTPDVGFHLRAGEHVLDGNGFLRKDPFSFSMRDHDYVATSWAYEVSLAMLERAGGPAALVLLHVAFVMATFAVLWLTARLAGPASALALPLLLLGVLASEMRFSVRPELLSYLLLACVGYLLHRYVEKRHAPLWLLPIVFLVWANGHSLFVLGLGLLACCLLGKLLEDQALDRKLLGWCVASAGACFINPYGLQGVLLPRILLSRFDEDSPFRKAILEYGSPFDTAALDASASFPWLPFWSFRIFTALALLGALGLVFRGRWWCVLALLLLTWPATRMIKNMPILVVVGFAPAVWGLFGRVLAARWLRRAVAALVLVIALLLTLRVRTDAYYGAARRWEGTGLGWSRTALPVDAVDHLAQAGIEGRGLNHLNVGGWLMWSGRMPVFVDGRLEVVGEELFAEHMHAFSSVDAMEEAVRRWNARWVLLAWTYLADLMATMSTDARWTLVYADGVAALFVRSDHEAALRPSAELTELLAPKPLELGDLPGFPDGPPRAGFARRWLEGLVRAQGFPRRAYQIGRFHQLRGESALAAAGYAAAIRESRGNYVYLYEKLSEPLIAMERWNEAAACFRVLVEENPRDRRARRSLKALEERARRAEDARSE